MVKARDLAALAGLAGLAYAYNNRKSKGDKDDAGDQKTSAYTGDTKKVGALEDTFKPTNESAYALTGTVRPGVGDATNDSLGVQKIKPSIASPSKTSPPKTDPRDRESGMSRGTRAAAPKNPNYSNEGRSSTASSKNPNYSNEGRSSTASSKNPNYSNEGRSSTAPAATTTKVAETPTVKSKNMLEEAKEEARRRAAASQATRTSTLSSASSVTRTPFPGSSALNKKHGGAVKMASGGMTVSKRADGIAQRGKTRGKIC